MADLTTREADAIAYWRPISEREAQGMIEQVAHLRVAETRGGIPRQDREPWPAWRSAAWRT